MPYLPVLTVEKNNLIAVYAVNPNMLADFKQEQNSLCVLNLKSIQKLENSNVQNVKYIGTVKHGERFLLPNEFNNENLTCLPLLNNLEEFVKFDENATNQIISNRFKLINVKVKKNKGEFPYSVGYSLTKGFLSLYSLDPSKQELLYRLKDMDAISSNIVNAKFIFPIPINRLFGQTDVPQILNILNYLDKSVNISSPLEYLNMIILSEYFSHSDITNYDSLCTKALTYKPKLLVSGDIPLPKTESYIVLFNYNHYLKNIELFAVEESIIHKENSKFTFGYVDEDAFSNFINTLSGSDKKKIFKFKLEKRNTVQPLTENDILNTLTYTFKHKVRVNLNTSLETLSKSLFEIEQELTLIKSQYLFAIHSSSLFFEKVISKKMKENKKVRSIFYME